MYLKEFKEQVGLPCGISSMLLVQKLSQVRGLGRMKGESRVISKPSHCPKKEIRPRTTIPDVESKGKYGTHRGPA
jgi:hypothetical protein